MVAIMVVFELGKRVKLIAIMVETNLIAIMVALSGPTCTVRRKQLHAAMMKPMLSIGRYACVLSMMTPAIEAPTCDVTTC